MKRTCWLSLLAVFASACAPSGPRVPFRVITLGDDPFFGSTATAIAVSIERHGVRDPASTTRFAPDERTLTLPPFPFGTDYAIVVETELSGLVLARGRSFPFSVSRTGADHEPDVSLGVLGRFGATGLNGDPSDAFVLAVPRGDGALLASPTGLTRLVAHGPDAQPILLAPTPWPAARVGGAFAALGPGVVAVGGTAPGASLVAADGTVLAELAPADVPMQSGCALVALDTSSALAIGGSSADGTSVTDVIRIAWDGVALTATALTPLPRARTGAHALTLEARRGAATVPRVLLLDGTTATGPADDVVLLDPSDEVGPSAVTLAAPTANAATCALDTGLVLLAGGRDAMGTVTGIVTILVVQPDQSPPVTVLAPAPPPLFRAREGAVAVVLGTGLALVVGGSDASGAAVAEAEIAAVSLDSLPGNVVLTGSVPAAANPTAAARLADHTVLVSTGAFLSVYFSPRGE